MYTRDMERLARSLAGQKVDRAYIAHYLIETYQIDVKTVEQILERAGLNDPKRHTTAKPIPVIREPFRKFS